ncbi:hypothetical protein [uncultured Halomonas sp.]|nr:hypothetical protein [uncultured Halomonas sp.]
MASLTDTSLPSLARPERLTPSSVPDTVMVSVAGEVSPSASVRV